MTQSIIFKRDNKNVIAKIIGINIEPLDTGNGKQVVFFCKDSNGRKYRVPKNEVIAKGIKPRRKKKARANKC